MGHSDRELLSRPSTKTTALRKLDQAQGENHASSAPENTVGAFRLLL